MRLYVDFFIIIGIIYSLHEHLSVIDLENQRILYDICAFCLLFSSIVVPMSVSHFLKTTDFLLGTSAINVFTPSSSTTSVLYFFPSLAVSFSCRQIVDISGLRLFTAFQ